MLCVSSRPSSSMLFPFLVCVTIIHPSDSILKVIYQLGHVRAELILFIHQCILRVQPTPS